MARKVKALGLALFAAFAMSSVLAAGAQAEGTTKIDLGAESAFLTAEQESHHTFKTGLGTITCETALFEGTAKDGDHHLTLTPTYEDCVTKDAFGGEFATTVNHTDCVYTFTGGKLTEGSEHHFTGTTVTLACNEGTGVHISVWNNAEHTSKRCEYTVTPFTDKKHLTVQNITGATDDITVEATVENIAVERTFGTFLQCGAANSTSNYTGPSTLRAYKDAKHTEQIGITMTAVS